MASNDQATSASIEIMHKAYSDAVQPLGTIVGLAEFLAEREYLSVDTVDQLNHYEGENGPGLAKSKEILVDILKSKGVNKFAEIKKCLREYNKRAKALNVTEVKSKLHEIKPLETKGTTPLNAAITTTTTTAALEIIPLEIEPLDIKLLEIKRPDTTKPSEMRSHPHVKSRSSSTNQETTESGGGRGRTPSSENVYQTTKPSKLGNLPMLLYIFLHKLIATSHKSQTVNARLNWLSWGNVTLDTLEEYFPSEVLGGVEGEESRVSMETLLEEFRDFCDKKQMREERKVKKERRKGDQSDDIEHLREVIKQKDKEIKEIHKINTHWDLECSELKQEIENLKSGKSSNESEDSSYQLKVAELEAQLLQSIRKEDYDNLTAELNQRQIQLEEVTNERNLLNEVVDNLQKELDVLKSTNESIIASLDKLKKEAEDDKSYIDELKDQVGNLRLNSAVKEPSVREMSILLESNRKLVEKIEAAEAAIDKAREEKNNEESKSQTFVKEIETLTKKLETVQDELVAHRTYINELEEERKERNKQQQQQYQQQQQQQQQYNHMHHHEGPRNPPPPQYNQIDQYKQIEQHVPIHHQKDKTSQYHRVEPRKDDISFASAQRTCAYCKKYFPDATMKEFTQHVASCLQ